MHGQITEELRHVDSAMEDELVLVDVLDRPVGTGTKLQVHKEGLLHRAFSVMVLREGSAGTEVLLARRAPGKYHSGGLWTNACCSHPRAGEQLTEAVSRRLEEELGVSGIACREVGSFVYRAPFSNGLTEYEYDHVFVGSYDGPLNPDASEVSELRWMTVSELVHDLCERPEAYTLWFPQVASVCLREGAFVA